MSNICTTRFGSWLRNTSSTVKRILLTFATLPSESVVKSMADDWPAAVLTSGEFVADASLDTADDIKAWHSAFLRNRWKTEVGQNTHF